LSVRGFSQTLAWLLGDEKVGLEHLMAVLPFTLAHRIQWKESSLNQRQKEIRGDPLPVYMAKEAVKVVHRRYMEQGSNFKNALSAASRIVEGEEVDPIEGDHPIYWEIMKDVGREVLEE
jgi:hypothetical protein